MPKSFQGKLAPETADILTALHAAIDFALRFEAYA